MAKRAKKTKRRELTPGQQKRLSELVVEETSKPIDWFRHDSDAHDDPAVARLLTMDNGLALYGMYWLLVEHMAARDSHCYSIKDDSDWAVLARDLTLCPRLAADMEMCRSFIEGLLKLGLINEESHTAGYVESRRLSLNCDEVGRGRAARRMSAEITNAQRWAKGEDT